MSSCFAGCESFVQRILNHASAFGDRIALEDGTTKISYRDVNRISEEVSTALSDIGIGLGSRVAVRVDRSWQLPIITLAAWRIGASIVLLGKTWERDRAKHCLELIKPSVLIAEREGGPGEGYDSELPLSARLGNLRIESLDLDARSARYPGAAYVMTTSGSTSQPRAVQVGMKALNASLWGQYQRYNVQSHDRCLFSSPPTFDPSIAEIFVALMAGACVVVYPPEIPRYGEPLSDFMSKRQITFAGLTPSILRITRPDGLSDLRTIISGGASPDKKILARWARGRRFINAYGPTEAAICCFSADLEDGEDPTVIGKPLHGVEYMIVDEHGDPVLGSGAGELWLSGKYLADGYVTEHGCSAENFIMKDAPGDGTARRFYRTADQVFRTYDGVLQYCGRLSRRVKVNEVFVHLDHIEEVIGTLHVIREATATVIRHPSGLDMVQVCYVLEEACSNPELVMREHLKKHDCSTGVAFEFRCSNRLSLLESGKLNRVDINFSGADSVISQTFDSPEELSNSVRALWISTLCLSVVGDDDNFFTLGGTSLDLVRLLSMIETRFGKRPSLALLYRDPTFSNLLKIVAGEVTPLDLRREMDQAQLDIQRLRGANKKRLVLSPVKRILITGSTGYFGRCLVQEAVRTNPAARIFCAVRGKTLDLAEQRFEELFRSAYQSVDQRSLRLLYLENWNCLSDCDEEFDQIIHGAADKNVFATIADLWGSNVHPLVPLLGRLARGGILQFCSTFPSLMQSGDGVRTFSSRRSSTGYEESKMLAEELLQVSAARNIVTAPTEASQRPALPSTAQSQGCDERDPINAIVYRLPLLLPDLRWPIWNRSDFLARVIAASVAIQKCPVIVTDVDIPWMPARLAARTMLESDGVGRAGVAELPLNVKWTSWNQMMAVLAELSGLALCDWDRWIDALSSDAALQSQARVLEALSKVYLLSVDGQGRQKHSDAQSLGDSLSSGYHWILQTDSGGPND